MNINAQGNGAGVNKQDFARSDTNKRFMATNTDDMSRTHSCL